MSSVANKLKLKPIFKTSVQNNGNNNNRRSSGGSSIKNSQACFWCFTVEVKVDDNPVKVELADTAGQDFLDPLRRLCYPDSDVFLLCFSVIKPDTFVAAREKWEPIFRKTHKPIVLIGTQCDLRSDSAVISQLLVIYTSISFNHVCLCLPLPLLFCFSRSLSRCRFLVFLCFMNPKS